LSGTHLGYCGSARHCGACWAHCAVSRWSGVDLRSVDHRSADAWAADYGASGDAHRRGSAARATGELTSAQEGGDVGMAGLVTKAEWLFRRGQRLAAQERFDAACETFAQALLLRPCAA